MKDTAILIPARYNSSRFPGKMLFEFDGVPLVRKVYDVCASTGIDTFVLTDDERIASVVPNSIMTSSDCKNGTERCASVVDMLAYQTFINVQGDMIDVTKDMIFYLRSKMSSSLITRHMNSFVTLCTDMSEENQRDPSVVKMIHTNDMVHWFGRSELKYGSRHIGIYGYDRSSLKYYLEIPQTNEEQIENLEQLRWLQAGGQMNVYKVDFDGIEINTHEDADSWLKKNRQNAKMSMEEKLRRYEHG